MVQLAVYVTPKAGRAEVAGWRGNELSVKVTVAPEGGKANAAACAVVAGVLGVAKSQVSVVRGHTSRHKMLEVTGVDQGRVTESLGEPESTLF